MKLTKEQFEFHAKAHEELLKQAEDIWLGMLRLEREKCDDSFQSVDSISFDDSNQTVYVSGWGWDSHCGHCIPYEYFYNEEILERMTQAAEKAREEERLRKEQKKQQELEKKEREEREEFKRLKAKFEENKKDAE
jgi:hypothetical protein